MHLIAFDVQPAADDYAAAKVSTVPNRPAFDLPIAIGTQHDLLGAVERLNDVEGITPIGILAHVNIKLSACL